MVQTKGSPSSSRGGTLSLRVGGGAYLKE